MREFNVNIVEVDGKPSLYISFDNSEYKEEIAFLRNLSSRDRLVSLTGSLLLEDIVIPMADFLGGKKVPLDKLISHSGQVGGSQYSVTLNYDAIGKAFIVGVELTFPFQLGFISFEMLYENAEAFKTIAGIEPYVYPEVLEEMKEAENG